MMSEQNLTCSSYICQHTWFRQKQKQGRDQQLNLRVACTLQMVVQIAPVSGFDRSRLLSSGRSRRLTCKGQTLHGRQFFLTPPYYVDAFVITAMNHD